jgi:gliotoxin/aspirochlorine biosynthesis glutathione S-transferase
MYDDLKRQYDVLNARLTEPGQNFLALKDRPTIADIANLMFAEPTTSTRMGLDLAQWPALFNWSNAMLELEVVKKILCEKDKYKGILPQ